ncbi:hypothetical protein PTR34_00850 [Serratia nevei]|uniref:hypothetical protein n=1 Tax=Serratia nevei TaxID=2703794 RepID=UPI00313BDCCD
MDNKLSELTNNARKAANSFYNWSQLANCTSERVSCLTVEQLKETSELLSALLAELEAKDEQNKLLMREIEHGKKLRVNMQNNADSLSERIAELEAEVKVWESATTKHLARAEEAEKRLPILEQDKLRLNEIINSEANRADAAEKRLATLVRLPGDLKPNIEPCVICGKISSHPEGWHYCNRKNNEGDA